MSLSSCAERVGFFTTGLTKKIYPNSAENVTYYYDGSNYTTSYPNGIGRLPGEILGNRLGSAGGRAIGEWANGLLNSENPDEDDYDDEWDKWYDESNQSCKRKGFGDGGNKGNNQAQNKSFDAATQGLTDVERRRVHDLISGKNYSYQQIKNIANSVKNGEF